MSDPSLLLGPLGAMKPLEGVQAGWTVLPVRPRSELVSSGGTRYVQSARRSARDWSLSFVWTDPKTVRWLDAVARRQIPGDIWFLDRAAAGVNMLPDQACVGLSPLLPVLDVDGVPLRALNAPEPVTYVVDVPCVEDTRVLSALPSDNFGSQGSVSAYPGERAFLAFDLPDPDGVTSATGVLHLRQSGFGGSDPTSVLCHRVSAPWNEMAMTWDNQPGVGALLDTVSVPAAAPAWREFDVDDDVESALGARWSVRLSAGSLGSSFYAREAGAASAPFLRLTLTVAVATTDDHTVRVPVRAGQSYTVSAWTDVASTESDPVVALSGPGTSWPNVPVPVGSGSRRTWVEHDCTADGILTLTVAAGFPGLVTALRVREGVDDLVPFAPGQGTPCRVSVADPQQTLQLVLAGQRTAADYQVVVSEVGSLDPGGG